MGCSGKSSIGKSIWGIIPDDFDKPTIQQPNECSEGYLARAGNPTGEQNGGPSEINKIINVSIPVKCDFSVDTTFKLSEGSDVVDHWEINPSLEVTFDQSTGRLHGTFTNPGNNPRVYNITITAKRSDNTTIDSKNFRIVSAKCVPGNTIKFIHPLPGSVCTSKCSPDRKHPVSGEIRPHKGCDFAYSDKHLGNVLAAADGQIVFAGTKSGYGNVVYIGHSTSDGDPLCITKYAHLSEIGVKEGQKVSAGDVIGIEGNTGVGTGAHLHFEIRGGKDQMAAVYDPLQYINGSLTVGSYGTQPNGDADPGIVQGTQNVQNNGNIPLTKPKVKSACSGYQTSATQTIPPSVDPTGSTVDNNTPNKTTCVPSIIPTKSEVVTRIRAVLDADLSLDNEDKNFILFVARIESNYNPYAKNPTSSATGLYQFLDKLAFKYGLTTCEDRCDIEKSTEAMIAFYKAEMIPYYNGWLSSGQTKIANRTIVNTPHSQRYPLLSKTVWLYGGIHHDGVGNMVKGIDKQGVEYCEKKLLEI